MPGGIMYWIVLDQYGKWTYRLPMGGIIARDKSLPTCLRKAATKLAKLGVR